MKVGATAPRWGFPAAHARDPLCSPELGLGFTAVMVGRGGGAEAAPAPARRARRGPFSSALAAFAPKAAFQKLTQLKDMCILDIIFIKPGNHVINA